MKVAAAKPHTIAAQLQALEYRMAMLSRHFRPWMTSGACFIGRTDALRRIYAKHSLWSPGEDIETGRVAHALRDEDPPRRLRREDRRAEPDLAARSSASGGSGGPVRSGTTFVNCDRNLLQLPIPDDAT